MSYPLQVICAGYTQNCTLPVLSPPTGKQINLFSAKVVNQSGSASDLAIGVTNALATWKFYQITAANTPTSTDYTAGIQGSGAVNIFDTTINDGFMVGCQTQFNVIGLTISQAQTGSPVYLYQYWNGSSWATLTPLASPATYAVGTQLVVFAAPQDWVQGSNVATGGASGYFYIKATATTAPSQIVQADAAWVVSFLEYMPQVANELSAEFKVFDSVLPLVLSGTAAVIPYFGVSNAKNTMRIVYSIQ